MPRYLMAEFHLRQSTSSSLPRVKQPPKASKIPGPFFYAASDDGTDENLLILLHGLGDTHVPFSKLGKSLKLPQTAVLALRAPEQVPFLYEDAYQWYTSFDDLGEIIERPNPTPAFQFLGTVIDHLTNDCTWPLDRIHFFGFAQGGSVAAEFALERWKAQLQPKKVVNSGQEREGANQTNSLKSFASVVTISGPLLSYPTLSTLCPTPTLVAHRSAPSETTLPTNALNFVNGSNYDIVKIVVSHTDKIIDFLKKLSLHNKLKKNKDIEAQNEARDLKTLEHLQDPVAHPDAGSETASLITIDSEDIEKLRLPSFRDQFRDVMPERTANDLAILELADKVKRKREESEGGKESKRRCVDGSIIKPRSVDQPAPIIFIDMLFVSAKKVSIPLLWFTNKSLRWLKDNEALLTTTKATPDADTNTTYRILEVSKITPLLGDESKMTLSQWSEAADNMYRFQSERDKKGHEGAFAACLETPRS
ncbi:hypothetical protein NLJ89_g10302 [Agrocybe chaxingu]|uniref:Phospholipase/carboxylesterase/thioesterase domain-containing protein n=1 Tax=Agrocybe chaxingu TaxID=84603 RepID=A0A9W8MP23_9AGAR|nr:hypothetical protein NLJ89_g10302 [Agrocybe chaxingu]